MVQAIHLNAKGSALLAVHFIKFIRGTSSRSSAGGFPKELRQLGELLKMINAPDVKEANSSINNRMPDSEGKKDSYLAFA